MLKSIFVSLVIALVTACATGTNGTAGKPGFPPVSPEGLKLVPDTKVAAVYLKPGADLSQYDKVAILETYVSFAKNWQRDYNEDATFENQINDQQMQTIREKVATAFNEEVTRVLTQDGRQIVTTGGTGVLILRPAIINLQITQPDLMTPGMQQTFVTSAGSMTLYLEMLDGKTGDLIARVIDPEAADNAGMAQVANVVTNTADFDRVVRRWAQLLNAHLAQISPK